LSRCAAQYAVAAPTGPVFRTDSRDPDIAIFIPAQAVLHGIRTTPDCLLAAIAAIPILIPLRPIWVRRPKRLTTTAPAVIIRKLTTLVSRFIVRLPFDSERVVTASAFWILNLNHSQAIPARIVRQACFSSAIRSR
jgi:hypothetical protein